MLYYEDYRIRVEEHEDKYTIFDNKYGGRPKPMYTNVSKEKADFFIQSVLNKRKEIKMYRKG